jgi:hypothetical protein
MTKFSRTSSGKYSVNGKMYDHLIGTRAQVWHSTAYKTSGGLTRMDLLMNKHGRIVSKTKHNTARREKRLVKAGYTTKKGHFGFIKKGARSRKGRKGGDGMPTGMGFPNDSPMGKALSHGGRKSRRRYKMGGMNMGKMPMDSMPMKMGGMNMGKMPMDSMPMKMGGMPMESMPMKMGGMPMESMPMKMGGKRRHRMRGGNGVNYSLSPSHISGIKGDSGVDVQIIAGNAG